MRKIFLLLLLAFVCSVNAQTSGRVLPEILNVRVAPDASSPLVCTVRKGMLLNLSDKENPVWAETELPGTACVWIAKTSLEKNGAPRKNAIFRSGPGVRFLEYSSFPFSTEQPLKILETKDNLWFRIAPLPGMKGYVMKRFLEISVKKKTSSADEDPSLLDFVEGDERSVSMEGLLKPMKKPFRNAGHELLMTFGNSSYTLCYLVAPQLNLKLWEGGLVRIDGIQRWCRDCRMPIVEIEKIAPSWR